MGTFTFRLTPSSPRRMALAMACAALGFALTGCGGSPSPSASVVAQPPSVTLTWKASTSVVTGYVIYRSVADQTGPYVQIASTTSGATQYTDSAVAAGQTYFYEITSVDSSNNQSVPTSPVSAVIPAS